MMNQRSRVLKSLPPVDLAAVPRPHAPALSAQYAADPLREGPTELGMRRGVPSLDKGVVWSEGNCKVTLLFVLSVSASV